MTLLLRDGKLPYLAKRSWGTSFLVERMANVQTGGMRVVVFSGKRKEDREARALG